MLHTRGPIFRVFGIILGAVIIVHGDIFRLVALVLGANRLLAMAKDISGLHPIVIGEVFFQFINHSNVLQLHGSLQEHLCPHQFGISSLRSYEAIIFGI
jgi:hypothetical protein